MWTRFRELNRFQSSTFQSLARWTQRNWKISRDENLHLRGQLWQITLDSLYWCLRDENNASYTLWILRLDKVARLLRSRETTLSVEVRTWARFRVLNPSPQGKSLLLRYRALNIHLDSERSYIHRRYRPIRQHFP